jgi:Mrp family chromosome partitioning ATPase
MRKENWEDLQVKEALMNASMLFENQLVATKFYVPVASGPLICRPRLAGLLDESLKHPLTLVSAPAGFGKTTLAASWAQSLAAKPWQVVWVSIDEEDNDPQLFWSYWGHWRGSNRDAFFHCSSNCNLRKHHL